MKNVCCDKVEQKSSRGDTEVDGLLYFMRSFIFSQCRHLKTGVM